MSTGSRGEVTQGGTALSQHPGQRKKQKHAKNKALQEHKRFFDGQGHVQGTKVKVIPGIPYCYSYNCLFEFQQIWVSVLKQRQNKLKGSKSKSQQGQYIFFFFTFGIKPGCFIVNFITEKKQTKKSPLKCMCLRSEFSLISFSDRAKHNSKADFFLFCTSALSG